MEHHQWNLAVKGFVSGEAAVKELFEEGVRLRGHRQEVLMLFINELLKRGLDVLSFDSNLA